MPRSPVLIASAALALLFAGIVLSMLLNDPQTQDESFDLQAYPDIALFMEYEEALVPEEVKQRLLGALEDGGLDPERFQEATLSWHTCEQRCSGRILEASASSLTIEAVLDGREWTIGVGDDTRVSRGDASIEPASLREGEFVEVMSPNGQQASAVVSYAES